FGTLEYDFTPAVTVALGASYQWDAASGVAASLPFYADGRNARLPRDTTLDFDWTRYRSELTGVFVQYRQESEPRWALKLNASRWRAEAQYALPFFSGLALIDPVTNQLNERPGASFSVSPLVHTQETADVTLTGALDWFRRREEVAIGADFTRL